MPAIDLRPRVRPFEILLVEDNPGDVDLVLEVLKDSRHHVSVATDGVGALALLRRQGAHEDARRPDLILLDLNLPKKSGREVLSEIKADPELKHIPVVILTSSRSEQEVLAAYQMHANCYVTKPIALHDYWSAVREVERFWLGRVQLAIGAGA